MDTKMKLQKSLPPSVEGKIHGYLKFVVDEVIWSNRNFGEIKVFVSWWGETDKSEFRPADITKNVTRPIQEITEIYAIRTNISLFEEYIKNCECLELTIVSEETNTVLGVSQVTDLMEIFKFRPYFQYVPIVTDCGNKIGEIHLNIKLELVTKSNMPLKAHKFERKQPTGNTFTNAFTAKHIMKASRDTVFNKRGKPEENETCKSILKLRKSEFQEPINKFNNNVTDTLVAHVVARAQKLRGAILKETYNDDRLSNSSNSSSGSGSSSNSSDHSNDEDIKLMSSYENKSLCTLSLTDLRSTSLKAPKCDQNRNTGSNIPSAKIDSLVDDTHLRRRLRINSEDSELFNFVNHIKINVESFALSPAGYRRVKSSSISNNDNTFLSATYFVQYSMTFDYMKENEQKLMKERKPVRIISKKQDSQVIYFNHRSTYTVPKLKRYAERSIKFKVFVRHLNRKSLIELGNATICLENVMKTENWRLEQKLIIVNKGIKIGDLNVIIELGSDSSHFDKYIDKLSSAKENIPTLDTQQLLNENRNKRTKSQSKTCSTDVSSSSTDVVNLTGDRGSVTKSRFITETIDNRNVDTKNYENIIEDEILLHGLIYVAEGRELPELNTYLICRAFWREDKTKSQVCNNTKNPFYKFLQLVPLMYNLDLLERIKDNYIVIEIYSKKNNVDNLLGLTKLSLHQLYVAYRDPRVLPHLLLSKYPVISVDGWVPIVDPVTGHCCGQLLVLVALGSAEQIALLETSRGLRTIDMSQTIRLNEIPDCANCSHLSKNPLSQDCAQTSAVNTDRELYYSNSRTQECQTDITTVKEYKMNEELQEKALSSSSSTLHDTIDHLAKMININKINIDQAAQTDRICLEGNKENGEEHTCMNELQFSNSSDDSDNNSVRHNYRLPTEAYRSVGVGAEYNEEIEQLNTGCSNATSELPATTKNDSENVTTCGQTMFRAIVEIECALHLPKVEKLNETVEPTTYASFQTNKNDYTNSSYTVTNVYPRSCNPKWNWKCETELSADLLVHDEKRLIIKIWRVIEPDIAMESSLDRDVVIGFSAIDLSVLLSGFPQVSGWFHIMDFTGKCNGQIKVCITPLDNLSLFGKPGSVLNTVQLPSSSMPQLNWAPYSYEMQCGNMRRNNIDCPSSQETEVSKSVRSETQSNTGFEDVSMSFLSLSLKRKLTELDEITKRLQSRLRDVTSTAFEDDLENEFEPNNDVETNNDYKVVSPTASAPIIDCNNKMTESEQNKNVSTESNVQNYLPHTNISCNEPGSRNAQQQSSESMQNFKIFDNNITEYPERGTKTHINYLLDKLSLNSLPVKSRLPTTVAPIRKTVQSQLLASNGGHWFPDHNKSNEESKICTASAQTDDTDKVAQTSKDLTNYTTRDRQIEESSELPVQLKTCNRMSMVIRDELIAEESNNTSKCDELTTYLLTSNVRHMDLNNIFSPLFYPYLYNIDRSPEEETVEQLDNRYTEVFNASINDKLNKAHSLLETPLENAEICRMTPFGVSENVNDSIDLTILNTKTSYNDLLASNTESTTTISSVKSMEKSIDSEILENCDSCETSAAVLVLSRQAPDGGNPVEDTSQLLVTQQQEDETQHSSSSGTYN